MTTFFLMIALNLQSSSAPPARFSCAGASVYFLCVETGARQVADPLAFEFESREDGWSVADILEQTARRGLQWRVGDVRSDPSLLKRPGILHFAGKEESSVGHFIFSRPVADGYDEVQLIDLDGSTRILSTQALLNDPGFSGWGVVQKSTWDKITESRFAFYLLRRHGCK
ncbi:MAG: hypothetical protein ACRC1K_13150 [Planctomycetia bacterium]